MVWFLYFAGLSLMALGAGTCGYVVGDYRGFRRGKLHSYSTWHQMSGRVWTEPGPRLRDPALIESLTSGSVADRPSEPGP